VIEAGVRTRLDFICHYSDAEDLAQEAQAILDYGHVAEMESVQHPSAARLAQRPLHGSLALVAWALDELREALAAGRAAAMADQTAGRPEQT